MSNSKKNKKPRIETPPNNTRSQQQDSRFVKFVEIWIVVT